MKIFRLSCASALLATGLIGAPAFAGPTLLDGSFESVNYSDGNYAYTPSGSAWDFTGGAGITGNNSAWGFASAPDGHDVAFLQNVSSISQMITGLVAGQNYVLNFDLSARPGYGNIDVSLGLDGDTHFNVTPTSTDWATQTVSFKATGATEQLMFSTDTNWGDHDAGLDNVRIAAVPEPASWALMLGGFGAIGSAMRRRKSATASFA